MYQCVSKQPSCVEVIEVQYEDSLKRPSFGYSGRLILHIKKTVWSKISVPSCAVSNKKTTEKLNIYLKPSFLLIAIWVPNSHLWAIIEGDSLIHPMLITLFLHIRPKGHWEPHSEVGSLSPAERVGIEPGTFRF